MRYPDIQMHGYLIGACICCPHLTSIWMECGKRTPYGKLDGMWQAPTIESTKKLTRNEICGHFNIESGFQKLGTFSHTLSHKSIEFHVYEGDSISCGSLKWHDLNKLSDLPFANAQRKVLAFKNLI